ncbi:MAG: TRAP transporter substrate-binding protein DctP [Parasporobacterium sp.]|nr:TRAP transporter substrate-binding protein DctP [Parasporobacterium sp.]
MKKRSFITLLLTLALSCSMAFAAAAQEPAQVEPQNLVLTTTFSENEFAGQFITHMIDKLAELSGGAITVEVFWGGTYAAMGEELAFVGQGGADMSVIGQPMYTDKLSLLNFPSQVITSYEDAINLMDTIAFKNEKTAPLVQEEIEKNNVHMIGSMPGGSNSFITKNEYTSLADMKGLKMGIGMNQTAMEMLGFNVVTMMPWDYYDQLSRGVADAGYMSSTALISMSLHEVMPYFLNDGTHTAGNFITINLDKWNSFDDTTKAIFEEAVADTQAFACETASTMDAGVEAALEAVGGKMNVLNEEDAALVQKAFFETGVSDARGYAAAAGTSEAMEIILPEVAAMVGLELPE